MGIISRENMNGKKVLIMIGRREERVRKAEEMVEKAMKSQDASHDASHALRVELAALFHDIADYKYIRDPSEEKIVENFLNEEGVEENIKSKILKIIKGMGFKEEVNGNGNTECFPEFGVVQDADRLDAIGAIGIARCFTFGGSRKRLLHDPAILPRSDLSKEQYMNSEQQTTINHFHEKLLKVKDMMKTKAGQRRAERRHKFMEEFVKEFYDEWNGLS
ncbi:hypothetical protein Lalb_Chr01g0001411 [Lupinus albus]|uniref:HD domain-containing protein n=1 Tax=Lupinus albus TaxID=3870 RepID=A0A6A4R2M7_LUPAL|nr:hypothetical protein Lalb_Chr01g0001411 [Lupinus albus]